MSIFKHLVKNAFYLYTSRIISRLSSFILIPIITFCLLPEEYGHYVTILGWIMIIKTFLFFGSATYFQRDIAKNKDNLDKNHLYEFIFIRYFVTIASTIALALITILFFCLGLVNNIQLFLLLILLPTIVVEVISDFSTQYFSGLSLFLKVSIIRTYCGILLINIVSTIVVILTKNIFILGLSYLLSVILQSIVSIQFLKKEKIIFSEFIKLLKNFFNKKLQILKNYIKYGFNFVFVNFIFILLANTDLTMLYYMEGSDYSGLYKIASSLTESLLAIFLIINQILFPFISNKKNIKSNKFHINIVLFYLVISIAALFIIHYFSDFIFQFLGEKYYSSLYIFRILLYTLPLTVIFRYIGNVLIAHDLQIYYARIIGIALIINIAANLILIPLYKELGASYSTLISQIFLLISTILIAIIKIPKDSKDK